MKLLKSFITEAKKFMAYEDIKKNVFFIKDMGEIAFIPKVSKRKPETFEEAQKRLRISEATLNENYKAFARTFFVSTFFAIIGIGLLIDAILQSKGVIVPLAFMSFTFMMIANTFHYSFKAAQIETRKMLTVREFLANKSNWIPQLF